MENCLVNKLKSVVNNDNLLKMDEFIVSVNNIPVSDTAQQAVHIGSPRPITLTVLGNGAIATSYENLINDPKTEITITTSDVYFSIGDYEVKIGGKYTINDFQTRSAQHTILSINIEQFKYSENIETIKILGNGYNITGATGDINCLLSKTNLSIINLNSCKNIHGDISNFVAPLLRNFEIRDSLISGNINNFGRNINLSWLTLTATNLSGSIESFVASARNAGRTTAEIHMNINNTNITFNGSTYTDAGGSLSWTANTITFNGVTINA